jgi:23S rRNA G2445 N2-methylase RlmL
MRLSASCLPGTEDLLRRELQDIGAGNVRPGRQAVNFEGNDELMLRALGELPSALRVYQEISEISASTQTDLYRSLRRVKWERYVTVDQSFSFEVIESGGRAPGPIRYITLKAKDALVDYFREEHGKRPSVDRGEADIRFLILFDRGGCRLYRDAAGRPLSQRGYRLRHAGAPLNEALAWALLNFSGFSDAAGSGDGVLIDPMCGSGTIPIEAALHLKRLGVGPHPMTVAINESVAALNGCQEAEADQPASPSSGKRSANKAILVKAGSRNGKTRGGEAGEYMCFSWADKGSRLRALHAKIIREGAVASGSGTRGAKAEPWLIIAGDLDPRAISIARENAARAGVQQYLAFVPGDFLDLRSRLSELVPQSAELPGKDGQRRIIILNPPYDKRLTLDADQELYARIGDCLKHDWKGYSAHVFSANRDALKQIGLRSEKRTALKNGPLQASLHSFSLY